MVKVNPLPVVTASRSRVGDADLADVREAQAVLVPPKAEAEAPRRVAAKQAADLGPA
jgi:hypothetical protein